jgi:hypothetical protein
MSIFQIVHQKANLQTFDTANQPYYKLIIIAQWSEFGDTAIAGAGIP